MDEKLARGFARDGFRRDMKGAGAVQDESAEFVRPYIEKLVDRGKLSKEEVAAALKGMVERNERSPNVVVAETFVDGSVRGPSTNMEFFIVGGCCYPLPMTIAGRPEDTLAYSLFYEGMSRKRIEMRTRARPFLVRSHAVARYIERSDAAFRTLPRALWPGLLLLTAFEAFSELRIARSFMLPASEGAFLGVEALTKPDEDVAEGTGGFAYTRQEGVRHISQDRVDNDLIATWTVNTYVSLDEMSDVQRELRAHLLETIEAHRKVFTMGHLMQVVALEGDDPASRRLSKRFFGDLPAAKREVGRLLECDLWRRGVRDPKGGVFDAHFAAERALRETE